MWRYSGRGRREPAFVSVTPGILANCPYNFPFGDTVHLSVPVFELVVFGGSVGAGFVGAIAGLGGGVLLVPMLTIGLGVDLRFAIGASIVSVIATSSGAAAAYVRDHLTNLRIGMFLEIATTVGAITGALVEGLVHPKILFIIFGVILMVSVAPLLLRLGEEHPRGVRSDWWAKRMRLAGQYPDARTGQPIAYEVTGVPVGFLLMYVAGVISGLLGIGSGTFKVLAMDTGLRLPMKVSSTTSNFMIGVTAAASAGVYLTRGDVAPLLAAPVALGVLAGATLGSRFLVGARNTTIRRIFIPLMFVIAIEMLVRGIQG
ncbi:MAG: sulfite exporter TauE/SafE family protein [Chloroflexota bacterium]|nr:sulfite exporter TauE/SafE family protein [Chloroflexota bacterium]